MRTSSDKLEIAIAGGGIAGLSASLCLARHGFSVCVYEKAKSLQEIGAGIQLSPNAIQVLRRIGLDGPVASVAVEPEAIDIRDGRNGTTLTSIPLGEQCNKRYGAPYLVVHRADLMQVLARAAHQEPNIEFRNAAEIDHVRSEPDRVVFSVNGEEHQSDLLVAADGIHSSIRWSITGNIADDLGKTAWRATLCDIDHCAIVPAGRTGLWLGSGAHLVHYPLREGRELNLVLVGSSQADAPHFLLSQFDTRIRQLAGPAKWSPWPLMHVDTGTRWSDGRVALIGDAAHAMLPTAAQGGAQAIEDGFVLAQCLQSSPGDPISALLEWERVRKPRVQRIARQAQTNLKIYSLGGLSALARNLAIRTIPAKRHLQRFDWLYGWTPQ